MNIAFYVSGKASRLEKILEGNFKLLEDVKLVFSDDADTLFLKPVLLQRGIAYELLDHKKIDKSLKRSLVISNALLKALKAKEIDYCFCFGRHLLKGEILTQYENKIINFHPAILPFFPGMDAIDQAIEAKVKVLGNTAHFIDQGMDTGPIIMQNVISVEVFKEKGYAGVLDYQLIMIEKIHEWLRLDMISVKSGEVVIEGSNNTEAVFFPSK